MPIHMEGRHGEPYRPSNGTEGDRFEAAYCDRCTRHDPDAWTRDEPGCPIHLNALVFGIGEEGYPEEWVWAEGYPLCTAYDPTEGAPPAPVSLT